MEIQADLIARSKLAPTEQLMAAGVVIACNGNPGRLPVAHMGGRYLSRSHLDATVRAMSAITLYEGEPSFDEDIDDCHPRDFKSSFRCSEEVMFLGELVGMRHKRSWWPGSPSYRSVLESILERRWKKYDVDTEHDRVVGRVSDIEILRDVEVFTRRM
jgi:hypothetical protein